MATLIENTSRAIAAFDRMVANIEAKGVSVSSDLAVEQQADKILEISGGSEDALLVKSDAWGEVSLPEELAGTVLYIHAFKGNLYIGSGAAGKGIWKFDRAAQTFTQILTATGSWQYFTEYKGDLYAGSSSYLNGIYILNADGNAFTQVWTSGAGNISFMEYEGNTYVSFPTGGIGLFKVVPGSNVLTRLYATGNSWDILYLTKQGELLFSSSTNTTGVLRLNETGDAAVLISNTAGHTTIKEFEDDIYFVSGTSSAQTVLKLNPDRVTTSVVTTPQNRSYVAFYEFDGELFLYGTGTSSGTNYGGVLKLNSDRTAFTALISGNYSFPYWSEIDGDLYVTSNAASASGLFRLNADREGFTNIVATAFYGEPSWHKFENDWYFSSKIYTVGLFRLDEETTTRLYTAGNHYGERWYEINGGLYYVPSGNAGILKLNDTKTAFTSVFTKGNVAVDPVWFKGDLIIPNSSNIAKISSEGTVTSLWGFANYINLVEYNDEPYVSGTANTALGILKLNEDRTAFAKIFDYGYGYTNLIGDMLVSNVTNSNVPVFDLSTETAGIAASGDVIVGDWVLNVTGFIKIGAGFPAEAFMTNSYIQSLTVVGDELGNVFVPTNNDTIIFNTKPL